MQHQVPRPLLAGAWPSHFWRGLTLALEPRAVPPPGAVCEPLAYGGRAGDVNIGAWPRQVLLCVRAVKGEAAPRTLLTLPIGSGGARKKKFF